jgi:preprotein translocase subunit SecG
VHTVLLITQLMWSLILIVLVLMHSGKDAGLSGAFGVGAAGQAGGSLMERNLNRWTIVFAVLFLANAILLQRY